MTRFENVEVFIREKVWLENSLSENFSCINTPTFSNLVILHTYLPVKMEQCSETSTYKIQTPRNYPEKSIQHSEHGESLKSRYLIHLKVTPSLILWPHRQPSMRSALLCDITQHIMVIPYGRLGTGCPETSVRNCHCILRNIPERRISQPLRGRSLKSRTNQWTNEPNIFRARCLLDRSKVIR
jgi:hypothetical protein